jgi:hypothetical protein
LLAFVIALMTGSLSAFFDAIAIRAAIYGYLHPAPVSQCGNPEFAFLACFTCLIGPASLMGICLGIAARTTDPQGKHTLT